MTRHVSSINVKRGGFECQSLQTLRIREGVGGGSTTSDSVLGGGGGYRGRDVYSTFVLMVAPIA